MTDKKYAQFEKWIPSIEVSQPIFIEAVIDDSEGFRILFSGSDCNEGKYRINVENYAGYRNFDEAYRLASLPFFPSTTTEWCFFKTHSSSYIDWFLNECKVGNQLNDIVHFIVATDSDIIDILAGEEPIFEKL